MSDYFDNSHVMNIGEQGSLGPAVSPWEMVVQNFRHQWHVNSAFALDQELDNRWRESLRAAGIQFNPSGTNPYVMRQYAQFIRDGTVPSNRNYRLSEDPDTMGAPITEPEGPGRDFVDVHRANEAIWRLNNPQIKTFEQILAEVSQMQHDVEQETASMSERAGTFGNILGFAGSMAGSFTIRDPLNIMAGPFGGGRTIARRIATDMGIAAGIVTITEFGDVGPNRELAGLPEHNPLLNILAATIGAGIIRGGIEGVGAGVRSTNWYQQRQALREQRLAIRELEHMNFDARDTSLRAVLEMHPQSPSARAAISILDDTTFIERNNPYGAGYAASERFIAELRSVQRAMNGEPMTAIGRVLPPVPFEYIQKAADFEIVREQAPAVYARMEQAQARVADLERQIDLDRQVLPEGPPPRGPPMVRRDLFPDEATWKAVQERSDKVFYASKEAFRRGLGFGNSRRVGNTEGPRTPSDEAVRPAAKDPQLQRNAANKEYREAYSAVEAESVRLHEQQARAEVAQQSEASNILAQVSEGRPFVGPLLRYDSVESLVERINAFNDTLDVAAVAAFARQAEGEGSVRASWLAEDGRVDIGLREPVDPDFRVPTDEGEMSVTAIMRDLQDDVDLVAAIKVCSI